MDDKEIFKLAEAMLEKLPPIKTEAGLNLRRLEKALNAELVEYHLETAESPSSRYSCSTKNLGRV